jgi:hypothetical protein
MKTYSELLTEINAAQHRNNYLSRVVTGKPVRRADRPIGGKRRASALQKLPASIKKIIGTNL